MAEIGSTSLFSDANLKSYYKLEDVLDSKASNNLTNNNVVTFSAAKFNNGANLGTSNTNKDLTFAGNLGVLESGFTVSCWVKILTEPGTNVIYTLVENRTQGTSNTNWIDYKLQYQDVSGTKSLFFNRSKPGVGDQGPTYTVTLGTSNIYNIVFTWDNSNIHGYVNGVDQTGASAASGVGNAGADAFTIGSAHSASQFASALIDDVGIFNRALTSTEVSTLFNDVVATNNLSRAFFID